jgi:hypothetical protein
MARAEKRCYVMSEESFLTLKADISTVEDRPQLSTLFHSKVSRVASNREPYVIRSRDNLNRAL